MYLIKKKFVTQKRSEIQIKVRNSLSEILFQYSVEIQTESKPKFEYLEAIKMLKKYLEEDDGESKQELEKSDNTQGAKVRI